MALSNIEFLRGVAAARLAHLPHPDSGAGALSGALTTARVLSLAHLITTIALILLWFAGELERFADGEPEGESAPKTELSSDENHIPDFIPTDTEVPTPEPVRCRWCREMVVCHADGAVFDLNERAHVCGLDKVLGHPQAPTCRKSRRKKRKSPAATPEPFAPP